MNHVRLLMLPITFDNDPKIRISPTALGIFAVVLLFAGFTLTVVLCSLVRDLLFQARFVLLPSLISCGLGFLTVFYCFLISGRYSWNVPALLTTIAAAVGAAIYAGMLLWTFRKISSVRSSSVSVPLNLDFQPRNLEPETQRWQAPQYYENYVRNMYPSAAAANEAVAQFDPNSMTEEEMQRQQMLLLLLKRDQMANASSSQSTFRIDWQGHDQEEAPPVNGYYAPRADTAAPASTLPQTSDMPRPAVTRQSPQEQRPWDRWNGLARSPNRTSQDLRDARRREIEMGR